MNESIARDDALSESAAAAGAGGSGRAGVICGALPGAFGGGGINEVPEGIDVSLSGYFSAGKTLTQH